MAVSITRATATPSAMRINIYVQDFEAEEHCALKHQRDVSPIPKGYTLDASTNPDACVVHRNHGAVKSALHDSAFNPSRAHRTLPHRTLNQGDESQSAHANSPTSLPDRYPLRRCHLELLSRAGISRFWRKASCARYAAASRPAPCCQRCSLALAG